MKSLTIFSLLVLIATIGADGPDYMKFLGTYRYKGGDFSSIVKEYYVPRYTKYSCDDSHVMAPVSCELAGMKFTAIDSSDEMNNLGKIARKYPKLFSERVFIRETRNSARESNKTCTSVYIDKASRKFFRDEKSHSSAQAFLCENFKYILPGTEFNDTDSVNVRETFFRQLGYEATHGLKIYFASRSKASVADAHVICQSFRMRLESPRSQDEYDNLKKLLNNYHNMGYIGYMGFEKSRTFAIDGHKSDDYQWVDNNEEILKFQMDPNFISSYSEADCIGIEKSLNGDTNYKILSWVMVHLQCSLPVYFVCEHRLYEDTNVSTDIDYTKFLTPLTKYSKLR